MLARARALGSVASRAYRATKHEAHRWLRVVNSSNVHWSRAKLAGAALAVAALGSLTLLAWDIPRVTSPKSFPEVRFQGKTLVGSGSQQRERDVDLVLANGRVAVVAGPNAGEPLHSVRYSDVISINYSRGRDPFWASPSGPKLVAQVRGGTLEKWGVSVQRDWVSLFVTTERADTGRFIVMRFESGSIRRILAALEERSGRTAQVLGEQ
jgi:hypothetical protein